MNRLITKRRDTASLCSVNAVSRSFFRNSQHTASIAAPWTMMSRRSTAAPLRPNKDWVRIRCPVLEIGRNSVMPSTRPRMIASSQDMFGLYWNPGAQFTRASTGPARKTASPTADSRALESARRAGGFQSLDCRHAPLAQLLSDLLARKTGALFGREDHGGHGATRGGEVLPLRVVAHLQAFAAASVRFAGQQEILESFRPAQGIATFERLQHGVRAQFGRTMHMRVITRGHDCELAQVVRHAQPRGELLNQRDPGIFVTVVRGQLVGRRHAFAEIMHEHRESHRYTPAELDRFA